MKLNKLNAHTRQLIALAITVITMLFSLQLTANLVVLITWSIYCFTNLILDWILIISNTSAGVKKYADEDDSSKTFIFIFIVFSAFFSLLAVFLLLISVKKNASHFYIQAALSIISVILSWLLIHTVFTIRYAHLYYRQIKQSNQKNINFPDDEEPDFIDFAYFAFTIGMTFQVSDVQVNSKEIRKLVLFQGLLSFTFNTAIIALSINVISSLLSK